MFIYLVTNTINDKQYVGMTTKKKVETRIKEHLRETKYNRNNNRFHNAIRCHGWDKFVWVILCECNDIDELQEKEIYYIELYDTFNNGYNSTTGGGGVPNHIWTDEMRENASKRMLENHPTKGKPHPSKGKKVHTEEHKQYIRELMTGRVRGPLSVEQRSEISERLKGHKMSEKCRVSLALANTGRIASDETKEKLRIANTGKKLTQETKNKISESGKGRIVSDLSKDILSRKHKGEGNPMFGKTMNQSSRIKNNGYIWDVQKDCSSVYYPTLSYWCKIMGYDYKKVKYQVKVNSVYDGYKITKSDIGTIDIYQWDDIKEGN